jgi:hypothetical protein
MLAMKRSGHVLLKVQENLQWREVMSKGNVVSFTDRKAEIQAGIEFLDLLDRDIKENPEGIQLSLAACCSEFKQFAIRRTIIVVASFKKAKRD